MTNYYQRPEISNSDLSWLKQQLWPREMPDPTEAYKFGALLDALITEKERVDYFNLTVDGIKYKKEDFKLAEMMKREFYKDPVCMQFYQFSKGQVEMNREMEFDYNGIKFTLPVRCKWDFWAEMLKHGGDLKSTVAKSQSEFETAAGYFDQDRQRAWYMDIAGVDKDILIGISKKNLKIFKIFITRESEFYKRGRAKYMELAFRWWLMFGNGRPEKC